MISRCATLLLTSTKHLSPPLLHRTSVTISWPYNRGHDFLRYKDLLVHQLDDLEVRSKAEESDPEFVEKMREEYAYTRDRLARIMGVDPDAFSDEDVRLSIEYLFPSDLSKKECRPHLRMMKAVEEVEDDPHFGAGYFTSNGTVKDAIYLLQRCIFEINNLKSDGAQDLTSFDRNKFILKDRHELVKVLGVGIDDYDYKQLTILAGRFNKTPGCDRFTTQVAYLMKPIETPVKRERVYPNMFEAKALVQQYNTTAIVGVTYGRGDFTVNGESYLNYFPDLAHRLQIMAPLAQSQTLGYLDVTAEIHTSGFVDTPYNIGKYSNNKMQHALCTKDALARSIKQYVPQLRGRSLLGDMVDPKMKPREWKKAGKEGPRHRYPWRKR